MPTAERYQQYELLRREDGSLWELGRGAMGITYKAYDTNLRFAVALKVINAAYLESETARQRFRREARAAAALRHPNVASVLNMGTDQQNYFYVMEFIDGETLDARVKRDGPMTPLDSLNIALQVARALAVAARQQLVHRDLKPSNLMLVNQEDELMVKVIDFGLAKVAKDMGEDSGALTMGGFVGTPHFASPEQVEEGEVDVRSDFYSLGATLYFALTGQSPFSGSLGQIMSQHLYKPLPMQPLSALPECVASLVQRMMEKDRNNRPQTPQELQRAITACLDEVRGRGDFGVRKITELTSASETLDLTFASGQPLGPGVTLARTYKLIEELVELPYGRKFLADDLRHKRRVNLMVLSPDFLGNLSSVSALREAVRLLRKGPHPMLREVYSLETVGDHSFLVEEYVAGISLLDLLRKRGALTAPEVARLLTLLAPLADHASRCGLQHVDLGLSGIYLLERVSTQNEIPTDALRRSLTAWETLNAKVDAINFSFSHPTGTWTGMATQIQGASAEGQGGSYVRLLSLLAYELLGGPRARLGATGQYTPVATLTQEGNAVLRLGLVDELQSADELSRRLAATVGNAPLRSPPPEIMERSTPDSSPRTPSSVPIPSEQKQRPPKESFGRAPSSFPLPSESKEGGASETLRRAPPPESPAEKPIKRAGKIPSWGWVLSILLALVILGVFYFVNLPRQIQEIGTLSIQTEPPGGTILMDGKPPQIPPNTFTHVPFGSHQLSATLGNHEPFRQEIQVQQGMSPEIRLPLRPVQELTTLSIQTEPAGANILLDGKPPQVPPNTFSHVPFGSHQISANLSNYEPFRQDIQVQQGMSPEIHLQLKPLQEIATLSIQTEPPGGTILLDGKPPQVPPNTFIHVPFGSHQISATLESYEPVRQEIQIQQGMRPEIRLPLKPIQEIATLSVLTEPEGAAVLLDGKPPQVPPNTFTHVPFGPHQLSATLDDYEPLRHDIQVLKGMSPEIRLQLKPLQEIAVLSVQTEPVGAAILLDGKPPQVPPNIFTHVLFGPHQLSAILEDYEPVKQEIQVRRGISPDIHLQLKPIHEIAALSIQTDPPGAVILLDGKPPQAPPNRFTHVPFGPHQLSATLDGCEPVNEEIQVQRGMSPDINLQLRPIQEIAALTVQTEPAGAAILLDGKPPQVPPNTFTHVPFGPHQLAATLEDYEPLKQDVQVRKGMSPEIRLQLKPMQEIAALSVQTDPSGAAILLDGKPPQIPPNTFTHVPFGPHQLAITLEDYEPLKQDFQVRKAMSPVIRLQLRPMQEIAALTVQTEPAGAAILLDGKPPQVPPNTFTHVPFGPHELAATLEDFEPLRQDFQVRKAMNPVIRLQLKPMQEIAALSVQTDPPGAAILLDGKPPQTPPGKFTHVPFGPHQLAATLEDFEPLKQDFQVRKGMIPVIRLQLKPIQEIAALSVQTDPPDASVLLDGKPPQVAPHTFTRVPFGPHQLTAALDNYETVKQDIEVRGGMNSEIRLRLTLSRETGPPQFALLLRDAQLGDSIAMMKVGLLYLKRLTPNDDVEGFQWLNQAFAKGNLEAGAYLGDCYLSGRGTKPDVQKAEEIVMPLANQNVVPAMTLAGRIFQYKADILKEQAARSPSSQARKRLDAQASELDRQAAKWWARAAEKDDLNASAHLAQCYENGWGVEKSEGEAEKRYKLGVERGNRLSMFFYGLMIQQKPGRHSEAEALITRAAAASLPSAMQWCKENGVPFDEKAPKEDRP
ncbi:MAG: PEGA domain-containing protein [Verrucomicrobia bacterium]|nr:PEGA domain-containing protein [Verrucomicrobiota bacterium]